MRALVTGGAGFIGSNLVDGLLDTGHEVVILDNLSTGHRGNLDGAVARGARLHELDVCDAAGVASCVAAESPDVVFHLAAQIDVRRSVADPAADARINVEGTLNVLAACSAAGVKRIVFSSTGGALYGEADEVPTPETAPIRPLAPYGQAKHAAEGYIAVYSRLHDLSAITLRYANVYGPRQDPLGEGGVVAIFCGKALRGEPAVVFGDGHQTRDFVAVGDVVEANLQAAKSRVQGSFNVGTSLETSVLDLVELLQPHGLGPPQLHPARDGEVQRSSLATEKVQEALGWSARTSLEAGLRTTLDWARTAG
jgi:UDP-glucose 4-epimerase